MNELNEHLSIDSCSNVGDYFWRKKTILYYFMAVLVFLLHCPALSNYYSQSDTVAEFDEFIRFRICQVAVPMFFTLSGVLFFRNYKPENYIKKLKKRFRSLVIPYLSWNVLTVIFAAITTAFLSQYFIGRKPFEWSLSSVLLGVFHHKYNLPFWFIFSLIYFVICTPAVDLLTRDKYATPFLIAGMLLLDIPKYLVPRPVFSSPNTLIYYLIGAYIGKHWIEVFVAKASKKISLLGLMLIVIAIVSECILSDTRYGAYEETMRVVNRIVYVMGVWLFADLFVDRIQIRPFMNHSFMIFALHVDIGAIVAKLVYMALPKSAVFAYFSFVMTVVLTLLIIEGVSVLLKKYSGRLYGILTGRRV